MVAESTEKSSVFLFLLWFVCLIIVVRFKLDNDISGNDVCVTLFPYPAVVSVLFLESGFILVR